MFLQHSKRSPDIWFVYVSSVGKIDKTAFETAISLKLSARL